MAGLDQYGKCKALKGLAMKGLTYLHLGLCKLTINHAINCLKCFKD